MSEKEVRNLLKEIEQLEQGIRENHVQTQSQLILLHYFFRAVGIINQNTALKALNMLKKKYFMERFRMSRTTRKW